MEIRHHALWATALLLLAAPACMAANPVEAGLAATFRIAGANTSGTCFLVSPGGDSDDVLLVTAAHVLEQMPDETCTLVLRLPQTDSSHQRRELPIAIRDGERPRWKRLSELDVAAMRIELPADVRVEPLRLAQVADEAYVASGKLRVGDDVIIPCFPAQLEANSEGWPILRQGAIASFPLTPIDKAKMFFVDCRSFGGESGAPVLHIRDGELHIVGLVHGMQRQTDHVSAPFEEKTMHMPLGLSIVIQAAYIREAILSLDKD